MLTKIIFPSLMPDISNDLSFFSRVKQTLLKVNQRHNRSSTMIVLGAFVSMTVSNVQGQSYTSTTATGLWSSNRWNHSANTTPYSSGWVANNAASFTSGSYSFSGAIGSGTVNVGNITVANGVTVSFTASDGNMGTGGLVRTYNVGTGSTLDFSSNAFSTAAGTGFIKSGAGVLALTGGGYASGFTLNAGTVIARGVDAMGADSTNVLTLNGGTVASNATRSFSASKFGGGIVIGGNVQFGELSTNVSIASSTANLSFANAINLGSAVRAITLGNNGIQTFSGIISNTSGGITFGANPNTDGRFEITNASNTFTGPITINGGEVRFTSSNSYGNVNNTIIVDDGRLATLSDATYTLATTHAIQVSAAVGTAISTPGDGTLTYNGVIANKPSTTGAWAKQGGGTLSLGGESTYSGNTAINNGTLMLTTGNDRLPTGTVVSLGQASDANLGAFNLNSRNQQIAGLNSTIGINATASNNTVTSSAAATLTLGGSGTYAYGDGTNANSGVITGAISLSKTGSGTQTLGDTNTYTGTTSVTGGTLLVNGSTSSISAVSVGDGVNVNTGKLGGTGTVSGTVQVKLGGTISAGADADTTPKTLTTGAQTWDGGGKFYVKLNSTTVGGAMTSDKLAMSGLAINATTGNKFIVAIKNLVSAFDANKDYSWIISTGTGISSSPGNLFTLDTTGFTPNSYITSSDNTSSSGIFSLGFSSASSGTILLNYTTSAPEPTTLLLLGAAILPLGMGRRRRYSGRNGQAAEQVESGRAGDLAMAV